MLPSEEAVDSKKIPRKWILRKNIENGSEMLRIALPKDELIANFEKRRDTRNKMRVTFLNLKWTISFYEVLFYTLLEFVEKILVPNYRKEKKCSSKTT